MNKQEFLSTLGAGLQDYPEADRQQYIDYYSEMIDDRIEEGLSEDEAVADIGTPQKATAQIKSENPIPCANKEKPTLKTWQIVLIAVGSPIWISLLTAALAVVFSLLVSLFAIILSLYAVAVSLGACSIAGVLGIVPMALKGNISSGIMFMGLGLICAGLCILSFVVLNRLTIWLISQLKKLVIWIQSRFFKKKEAVQ